MSPAIGSQGSLDKAPQQGCLHSSCSPGTPSEAAVPTPRLARLWGLTHTRPHLHQTPALLDACADCPVIPTPVGAQCLSARPSESSHSDD